jgi:hypothetical protein
MVTQVGGFLAQTQILAVREFPITASSQRLAPTPPRRHFLSWRHLECLRGLAHVKQRLPAPN